MNDLQIFKNAEFGEIRTVIIENEPWFVGKDVAVILGYADPNKAIAMHVDEDDKLNDKSAIGCAVCGRPVSRYLDDGLTCEINRVCTDGTRNACSMLYGACCRAAKAMGYRQIITYTLKSEPGTSFKASNFSNDGVAGGEIWTGTRRRNNGVPQEKKIRWVRRL